MNSRSIRIWLLFSALLALALAPYLARGDQEQRLQRQRNYEVIASLPPTERERLTRNLHSFNQLPPEEQQAIIGIHQALEHESKLGHHDLAEVMQQYVSWLRTLPGLQRYQLPMTTNPDARVAMMKDFIRSQNERTFDRAISRRGGGWGSQWGNRWYRGRVLAPDELEKIMTDLESRVWDRLSPTQQTEIKGQQGLQRWVALLQALKSLDVENRPLAFHPPPEFKDYVEKIDQYTDNSRAREFVSSQQAPIGPNTTNNPFASREGRFAALLMGSMINELWRNRIQSGRPGTQDLQTLFNSLPPEEQDRYLHLDASDFKTDLNSLFVIQDQSLRPDALNDLFIGGREFRMNPGERRSEAVPGEGSGERRGFGRGGDEGDPRRSGWRPPREGGEPGPGRPPFAPPPGDGGPDGPPDFRNFNGNEPPPGGPRGGFPGRRGPPGGNGPPRGEFGPPDADRPSPPPERPPEQEANPS